MEEKKKYLVKNLQSKARTNNKLNSQMEQEGGLRSFNNYSPKSGADPGFLLGGGAPLRNDVTLQDFS